MGSFITLNITYDLEELKRLIEKANQRVNDLINDLKEIEDFKLEIGTKQIIKEIR